MPYGINAIQVVPLFCLNKIRCCKASNFLMTLDVFMPFIQRSHVLKVQHG